MLVTYEDAKKAATSIRKAVDPCSIVLFGSVAREGSGNDLDLLILIDERKPLFAAHIERGEDAFHEGYCNRGGYPAEEGLLPMGSPTREEAEKSVNLASTLLKRVARKRKVLK